MRKPQSTKGVTAYNTCVRAATRRPCWPSPRRSVLIALRPPRAPRRRSPRPRPFPGAARHLPRDPPPRRRSPRRSRLHRASVARRAPSIVATALLSGARRTGTAAAIRQGSTAAAWCSGSSRSTASHCRASARAVRRGQKIDLRRGAAGRSAVLRDRQPRASHVGLALGGDQFVHAPSSRGVVRSRALHARATGRCDSSGPGESLPRTQTTH